MPGMLQELRSIAENLERLDAKYALIGALAVSVHVEPRTTRDIDIALAVANKEEEEMLLQALQNAGYNKRSVLLHMMPTETLGTRLERTGESTPVPIDFLTASSGIEPEVVEGASKIEVFPELFIPVASIGHLIAMKVISEDDELRGKDVVDLKNLFKVATEEDLNVAKESLSLIEKRGFTRGRDIAQARKKWGLE